MNESLFDARVEECRSITDYPTFLQNYRGSPVSSLAKEFGHELIEGRVEMFAGLAQSKGHSEAVNYAFQIFSECATMQVHPWKWNENWETDASRLVDFIAQNTEEPHGKTVSDFIELMLLLLSSYNPQKVSNLGAIVGMGRSKLENVLKKNAAPDSALCNALLTLSLFRDILLAARNSIFTLLEERNRNQIRRSGSFWQLPPSTDA